MECSYCKKTFSTRYVLINHQKTVKSCIKIQNELGIQNHSKFECIYCKKLVTTKGSLTHHYTICKKKKKGDENEIENHIKLIEQNTEDKIEQLSFDLRNQKEEIEFELKRTNEILYSELQKKDEEIKELKEHIKKVKTPPKITKIKNIEKNIETNIEQQNNITIYQIMSPEVVESFFKKHYNLDTLLGGQKALARFVNDGFLKEAPVYLCGDRSRQKFYIMEDGNKKEDPDCDEIIGLTSPGLPTVQEVFETALFKIN